MNRNYYMSVMQNTHGYKIKKNSPNLWIKYFPWKLPLGHKYSRGRVFIYGGKKEFIGATILSSLAALKTGTGSVKIICSKKTLHTYSVKFPSVLKAEVNNINELNYNYLQLLFNFFSSASMYSFFIFSLASSKSK